jgi:hypothetical protein
MLRRLRVEEQAKQETCLRVNGAASSVRGARPRHGTASPK